MYRKNKEDAPTEKVTQAQAEGKMKLIDWNCKRCGLPLPDLDRHKVGHDYVVCPNCGAKHMVDSEPRLSNTFVEKIPWPGWVNETTVSHLEEKG
jgi:uncharacterized Zn finger protein (UPF0148 family)